MRYDRARRNLDRHPNHILAAYMASATWHLMHCPADERAAVERCLGAGWHDVHLIRLEVYWGCVDAG
jgi:hypothetical protein